MINLIKKTYEIENEDIELSVKFKDKFVNIEFDFNAEFQVDSDNRVELYYFNYHIFEADINLNYDKFEEFIRDNLEEYLEEIEYPEINFKNYELENRLNNKLDNLDSFLEK